MPGIFYSIKLTSARFFPRPLCVCFEVTRGDLESSFKQPALSDPLERAIHAGCGFNSVYPTTLRHNIL